MAGPGLGDGLAPALDRVLESEAGAADLAAARPDGQPLVELDGSEVAHVDLGRRRFDALLAKPLVAAVETAQVLDPRGLEPDEVGGVVGDALRVRLREADREVEVEAVVADGETLRSWR